MLALIIGTVFPEPKSSAAGTRMMQIIQLLMHDSWEVMFATDAEKTEFSEDLEAIGITVHKIQLNDSSFDKLVAELNPKLVIFDRFMTEEKFGWRVTEACPNAARVLDMEDFHGLRKVRQQAADENLSLGSLDFNKEFVFRELASIFRCDLTLVISNYEMDLLINGMNVPESQLHYLPLLFESEKKFNVSPSFNQRSNFISLGNFKHPPNLDSFVYLKEEIWPAIKKAVPDAELHIYGAYPNAKALGLNDKNLGFIIKGRAEDAVSVMQNYKVCLYPLRFGAGLKGKIFDACYSGTPFVTSSIGAEGLTINNESFPGGVYDTTESFIQRSINLYSQQDLWDKSIFDSLQLIEMNFEKHKFGNKFKVVVKELIESLSEKRSKNFIGGMLQQQSHSASKFMSKWIEEKNRQ